MIYDLYLISKKSQLSGSIDHTTNSKRKLFNKRQYHHSFHEISLLRIASKSTDTQWLKFYHTPDNCISRKLLPTTHPPWNFFYRGPYSLIFPKAPSARELIYPSLPQARAKPIRVPHTHNQHRERRSCEPHLWEWKWKRAGISAIDGQVNSGECGQVHSRKRRSWW